MNFPDGLIVVVKRDCPTCEMLDSVYSTLAGAGARVYSQDDPDFPEVIGGVAMMDRSLECSYHLDIETVPTLLRYVDGGRDGAR